MTFRLNYTFVAISIICVFLAVYIYQNPNVGSKHHKGTTGTTSGEMKNSSFGPSEFPTSAIRSLPGEWSVAQGVGIYEIPIEMPSSSGLTPAISVVYHSKAPHGVLGRGFGISGISSIVRCPSRLDLDGKKRGVEFDANDQFCLDGVRLIRTATTIFELELKSWARIISENDPDGSPTKFTITNTKGHQSVYVGSLTRYEYLLQSQTDLFSNSISYNYHANSRWVDYIDYSGNLKHNLPFSRRVQFIYDIVDDHVRYVHGVKFSTPLLLKQIQTLVHGAIATNYKFEYQTGLNNDVEMIKASQISRDGIVISTSFSWASVDTVLENGNWAALPSIQYLSSKCLASRILPVDFNEDGIMDIIKLCNQISGTFEVYLGKSDGIFVDTPLIFEFKKFIDGIDEFQSSDLSGDGVMDLIIPDFRGHQILIFLLGNSIITPLPPLVIPSEFPVDLHMLVVDVNGDNLADLVIYNERNLWVYRAAGGASFALSKVLLTWPFRDGKLLPLDFNADGRVDLLEVYTSSGRLVVLTPHLSRSTLEEVAYNSMASVQTTVYFDDAVRFVTIDLNCDGNSDLIIISRSHNSKILVSPYISDGITMSGQATFLIDTPIFDFVRCESVDVNGDGKTDLVFFFSPQINKLSILTLISTGSGFITSKLQVYSILPSAKMEFLDYIGNAKQHILSYDTNDLKTISLIESCFYSSREVVRIENPFQFSISVDYNFLTRLPLLEATLLPKYPVQTVKRPTKVVANYRLHDLTSSIMYGYQYSSPFYHAMQSSLLGFENINILDGWSGILATHTYDVLLCGNLVQLSKIDPLDGLVFVMERPTHRLTIAPTKVRTIRLVSSQKLQYQSGNLFSNLTSSYQYFDCNVVETSIWNDGYLTTSSKFEYQIDRERNVLVHKSDQQILDRNNKLLRHFKRVYDKITFSLIIMSFLTGESVWLTKSFSYDQFGHHVQSIGFSGSTKTNIYDPADNVHPIAIVSSTCDGITLISNYSYDPLTDALRQSIDVSGESTKFHVDGFGIISATTLTYQSKDYVVSFAKKESVNNEVTGTTFSLNSWENPTWSWTTDYIDGFDRTYKSISSTNKIIEWKFDPTGHVTQESIVRFIGDTPLVTRYEYDIQNRLKKTIYPDTSYDQYTYNGTNEIRILGVIDGNNPGQKFVYEYITIGTSRVVSTVEQPSGSVLKFQYSSLAQPKLTILTFHQNGVSQEITLHSKEYDLFGRVFKTVDYDGDTVTFQFSSSSGLLETEKHLDYEVSYFYDNLDRLKEKKKIQGQKSDLYSYSYDRTQRSRGRVSSVTKTSADSSVSAIGYEYDEFGNTQTRKISIGKKSMMTSAIFSPSNSIVSKTYPDGRILKLERDTNMNLAAIEFAGQILVKLSDYDARNNPKMLNFSNRVSETQTFDAISGVQTNLMANYGNMIAFINETIVLDGNRRPLHVTSFLDDTRSKTIFSYSLSSEIIRALGNFTNEEFKYDELGNMIYKDGISYIYEKFKPISATADGLAVYASKYENGRMVSRSNMKSQNGHEWKYFYDFGNLVSVTLNGNLIVSFEYFDGKRIKRASKDDCVVYFGSYTEKCDKNETNILIQYLDRKIHISHNDTYILHRNFAHNIVGMTNTDGRLEEGLITYDAYGASVNSRSKYKYMGMEYDSDLELYWFGSRFYDTFTGRFISADSTLGFSKHVSGSYNKFALSLNNPISFADNGHSIWDAIGSFFVDVAEIEAGIALTILTDGMAAQFGSGLIGAGISGIQYGAENFNSFSWKDWGIQQGIGFVSSLMVPDGGGEGEAAEVGMEDTASVEGVEGVDVEEEMSEEESEGIEMCSMDCLTGDTLILTTVGLVKIDKLNQIYEIVTLTPSKELGKSNISSLVSLQRSTFTVRFFNTSFVINSTISHKFFVRRNNIPIGWVVLSLIRVGDEFVTLHGRFLKIKEILSDSLKLVYGISLMNDHTYFIGNDVVLVHNGKFVKCKYDAHSRLESAETDITSSRIGKGSEPNHATEKYQAEHGLPGDARGHLVAKNSGGDATMEAGKPNNWAPQNGRINSGKYRSAEKISQDYVKSGKSKLIKWKTSLSYAKKGSACRPTSFKVSIKPKEFKNEFKGEFENPVNNNKFVKSWKKPGGLYSRLKAQNERLKLYFKTKGKFGATATT